MGIFDDVVVNAKSAAQTVGKMAGQFVDMSKLRINMAELNGEITKRYQAWPLHLRGQEGRFRRRSRACRPDRRYR